MRPFWRMKFLPGKFQHMWNFQFLFYYSSYMGIKKQALLMKLKTSLVIRIKMKTICKHNWVKIYETEKINYSVQTIKICWRLGIMQWGENESYYTYFIKLFTRTLSYRKRKKLGRIMGLGTPQNIYYQMPHINMHSYFTMKPISLFGNIQELQINFFLNTYHFHFCSIE